MELIGAGRASQVFALDEGRVLRRADFDVSDEARTMRHVREAGYPVPEVLEVSGGEMTMERLHGPTLAAELIAGRIGGTQAAAILIDLHERLHRIPAPEWLPGSPRGVDLGGDSLLHLDLHPENVIVTDDGPRLVDWTNAARGADAADFAVSWAILAGVEPDDFGAEADRIATELGELCAALAERASAEAVEAAIAYREADTSVEAAEISRVLKKAAAASI
ncbi:hypothetical protein GCM10029992_10000 [Glycomyces albus]